MKPSKDIEARYAKLERQIAKAREECECKMLTTANGRNLYHITEKYSERLLTGGFNTYQEAWVFYVEEKK